MFEKASRLKLRFATPKGALSVEDLWDLPLTSGTGKANLDDIAKDLFRQLKDEGEVSFVQPSQSANKQTQLMFDIVKHVISVRLAENEAASAARAAKDRNQLILNLIAQKEVEDLAGKSVDELRQMLNAAQSAQ